MPQMSAARPLHEIKFALLYRSKPNAILHLLGINRIDALHVLAGLRKDIW